MTLSPPRSAWTVARIAPIVLMAVVVLVVNVLPAITGVLARQLGFEPSTLGAFGSADQLGMAAGALSAIAVMQYTSPRTAVFIGLSLLLAANFLSAISGWAVLVVGMRAMGGLGTGLVVSACYYMYSLGDQERNAAASMLSQTALSFVAITTIPVIAHAFGWRSVFLGLGLLVVPCFVLARYFPQAYDEIVTPEMSDSLGAPRPVRWLGLASTTTFSVAVLAYWTYIEHIGTAAGIPVGTVSLSLSISTAAGFLSSAMVLILGERVNKPILIACVTLNVLAVLASSSSTPWIFSASISVYYFTLPVYFAAQFGAIMKRAASRQFAAQYTLALYVGALGPTLGGLVVEEFGAFSVRSLAIGLTLLSVGCLWAGFFNSHAHTPVAPVEQGTTE